MASRTFPPKYAEVWQGFQRVGVDRISYCSFGLSTSGDFQDMTQTRLDAICQAVQTALRPALSVGILCTGSFLKWNAAGITPLAPIAAPSTIANQAGTRTGAGLIPANTAVLVRKVIGIGGRSGRLFLPSVLEGDVDDFGRLISASQTAIQAALTATHAAIDALESGAIFPALATRTSPTADPVVRTVASYAVQPLVATQRRRLR